MEDMKEDEYSKIRKLLDEVIGEAKDKKIEVSNIELKRKKNVIETRNYSTCLGKLKSQIEVNQTLIDLNDDKEIKSILAHEVGHAVKRHNFKLAFWFVLPFILLFFLFTLILAHLLFNVSLYYAGILGILILISLYCLSRFSESHEYAADNFCKLLGYDKQLIKVLLRMEDIKPNLLSVIFQKHPTIEKRIENLKK